MFLKLHQLDFFFSCLHFSDFWIFLVIFFFYLLKFTLESDFIWWYMIQKNFFSTILGSKFFTCCLFTCRMMEKKKRQVFVKTITRFSPFQDQMSARLNDAISSLLSPIFSKTNSFVLAVCFSSPPSWYQFKYTSRVQNNNTKKERKRNERTNQ